MCIERLPGLRRASAGAFLLAFVAASPPSPVSAQFPTYLLDEDTEVRSIRLRFLDSESFHASTLMEQIGLTERGKAYGLASFFSFLPLVPDPEPHPFDPLSLQTDVARLRKFYRQAGFPAVEIRYEVALEEAENLVDVRFLITEGRPRTLSALSYATSSGVPVDSVLDPALLPAWRAFQQEERALIGDRLGDLERARLETNPRTWLMDRGYPFPSGSSTVERDSTGFGAALAVTLDPGSRARVGSLVLEGNESVKEAAVLREVPLREGDWFSADKVSKGRQRVLMLGLFQTVTPDVAPVSEPDSGVQVVYRVREGRSRSVSGYLGYTNVGGLSLGGEWENRNLTGSARTLAVSGTAETGALTVLTETADQYFRGALSLRQPYLFASGLSFVASPFGEYRDDYRDRSWEAGLDATAVYQFAPLRTVSLRARVSKRKVLEYRLGDLGLQSAGFSGISHLADSLKKHIVVSVLTLSGNFESLDDPLNPKEGFVLQPSLEVTTPLGSPTNEYFKAEFWGSVLRDIGGGMGFAANLRLGRLFPFGRSVPSPESEGLTEFLQLRDVNLTAGGPTDVRGWGSRLVGPKIPETEARREGDTLVFRADRYLPLGGLARISGGVELHFPLPPFGGSLSGHVFLDGGKIWTPDDRFPHLQEPLDQDHTYFSTGGGIGIATPVGPIRVSLGYKLNPSPLDLRDPGEVQAAFLEGRPILEAAARNSRRFQLHLTVGRAF